MRKLVIIFILGSVCLMSGCDEIAAQFDDGKTSTALLFGSSPVYSSSWTWRAPSWTTWSRPSPSPWTAWSRPSPSSTTWGRLWNSGRQASNFYRASPQAQAGRGLRWFDRLRGYRSSRSTYRYY